MISSNSVNNPSGLVAIDASVIINLNATQYPSRILSLLPYEMVATEQVLNELRTGEITRGHNDFSQLEKLISSGLIKVVSLNNFGESEYLSLVSGQAAETLDDGEASTIGYALQSKSIIGIDERKAIGICKAKHPKLAIVNSLDLLLHPTVTQSMNDTDHAEIIFNALTGARMRVPSEYLSRVIGLIGEEKARFCSSIPKSKLSTDIK